MTAPGFPVLRDRLGAIVAAVLSLAAWLAFNLLSALGVLALAAFAIGNFTLAGTMLQLGNLTARFIAADVSRQTQFAHLAGWALLGAFSVMGLLRGNTAIKAFLSRKGL